MYGLSIDRYMQPAGTRLQNSRSYLRYIEVFHGCDRM